MDASDTYVMTEQEENGDAADACFLNSGSNAVHQNEDDEDSHDREEDRADCRPSFGWAEPVTKGVDHGGDQDIEIGT
jgi:hypothetical protein